MRKSVKTLTLYGTLLLASGLIGAVAPKDTEVNKRRCINNLRLLEAAKDQFAIETNLGRGDIVQKEDVAEYIRNGIPICPSGGKYTLNPIDTTPTCTIAGHVLH